MPVLSQTEDIAQVEIHSLCLRDGYPPSDAMCTDTEKKRAAAFRSPAARNLFVSGRGLCRNIMSRIVGCAPQQLRIAIGPYGKPFLPDHPDIEFNLSHSNDRIVLAISRGGAVGVDIEHTATAADFRSLEAMALILSDLELRSLERLDPGQTHNALLSYWVRKEALLKCHGCGLLADPRCVTLGPVAQMHDVVALPPKGTIFIHAGERFPGENASFVWAVATDREVAEPTWHLHDNL